ncbi:LysM peptidoglycan-binding domain-containing protein [Kineosporia succinea]|uniref:DNA-binding SARP family transcriptional activator n=1 Tax=Kineosporia succinea TaxID=84632 RepID=A0ABT9PA76_9ACTN|nr:LysM peptidoglycan-binding domain-containing protein [Kineosporia succinea]MDP9829598.1 DNA-binding SARP family transcriptional activator [Kineosporia succinea]
MAEHYLGDGTRWRDIWHLNQGRRQADGTTMTTPGTLIPGWTVLLPDDETASTPKANNEPPSTTHSRLTSQLYRITAGDTLSGIATRFLADAHDYPRIQHANQPHIPDPDHIHAGDAITLPDNTHDTGPRTHARGTTHQPQPQTPRPDNQPDPPTPAPSTPEPAPRPSSTTPPPATPSATTKTATPQPQTIPHNPTATETHDTTAWALSTVLSALAVLALLRGKRSRKRGGRHLADPTATRRRRDRPMGDDAVGETSQDSVSATWQQEPDEQLTFADEEEQLPEERFHAGPHTDAAIDRARDLIQRKTQDLQNRDRPTGQHPRSEPTESEKRRDTVSSAPRKSPEKQRESGRSASGPLRSRESEEADPSNADNPSKHGSQHPAGLLHTAPPLKSSVHEAGQAVRTSRWVQTPPRAQTAAPTPTHRPSGDPALPTFPITDSAPSNPESRRVLVKLFGDPAVLDLNGERVQGLRRGAVQVLIYLALHPEGAELNALRELLWPDIAMSRAAKRLSTEIANLRRTMRIALGDPENLAINAVLNTGSRYQMADFVVTDVAAFEKALKVAGHASTSNPARERALREAISLQTGRLAERPALEGVWLHQHRRRLLLDGAKARITLAQSIHAYRPDEALALIREAAHLDPGDQSIQQRVREALNRLAPTAPPREEIHAER